MRFSQINNNSGNVNNIVQGFVYVVSKWRAGDDSFVGIDSVWTDGTAAMNRAGEIGAYASDDEFYGGSLKVAFNQAGKN